jgi:hypothetical protein
VTAAVRCEVVLTQERSAVRLCLPPDASAALGTGRLLPAVVTINGTPVPTTLHKMGGGYMMVLNADLRRRLGVGAGDTVAVSVAPDAAPRTVEIPPDLAAALTEAGVADAFAGLSLFRRTEIVKAVEGAKQARTRASRIAKAVADLTA